MSTENDPIGYAKPSDRYVSDPKGNVFKIRDLSKKQI